jgi:hypothetical protein
MNESHFESSLRAFRPLTPPAAIEERIAASLFPPPPSPMKKERAPVSIRFEQAREPWLIRCFHNLGWAVAGAASAVAAIALYPAKPTLEKRETSPAPAIRMSAVSSTPSTGAESSVKPVSGTPATVPGIPTAATLPIGAGDTGDFQAVETTRELISTQEEEQVLYRNGNTPMRQVHNRYREHHSWTNPRTGARVDIEVPREDVFLKPVSLQ